MSSEAETAHQALRTADRASSAPLPAMLYLGDHFGYPSGVAHGVTIYLLSVLPELLRAGVDVTACFLREPHPAAAALQSAGMVPVFLSAHPWNPFVVFRVAALARARGCRVIHASGIKATLVARIVARSIGARVIVHVHDQIMPSMPVSALHRFFSRPSDMGLCVSHATEPVAIAGYHVSPGRIRVVHNGLDLERISGVAPGTRDWMRTALGLGPRSLAIAMIGRIYPIKGTLSMVRMMSSIVAACPDAVLLLAGDGPDRPACEQLVIEQNLAGHVSFLGHRSDIPDLLAASDLVVMPSVSEGLGLAAIEAIAAGLPVIAFSVGGLPEVVRDGISGRCVPAGDCNAFSAAVVDVLQDPELRRRYGEAARLDAGRFGLDRHVHRLLECYGEMGQGA